MAVKSPSSVLTKQRLLDAEIKLREIVKSYPRALVAYSGGVDSGLLAYVTYQELGDKMLAVLADSPSLSRREYRQAIEFVRDHGIPLKIVKTEEMKKTGYELNAGDRCYYCKQTLFEKISELSQTLQGSSGADSSWPILYGMNKDDLGDYRPGLKAAKEAEVESPLLKAEMDKKSIRQLSRQLHLKIADKQAMPCMASRIPHGQKVTLEKLSEVEQAEEVLYDLGFKRLRVRHYEDTARIEVDVKEQSRLLERRLEILQNFKKIGFKYISVDLEGFRSGALNESLSHDRNR